MKAIDTAALLGAIIVLSGCATSRVHFEEPEGSRLYLNPQGAHSDENVLAFPVSIDLAQKENAKSLEMDEGGKAIRISLSDGTNLKGFLYVYKVKMDQVEKLSKVSFRLREDQIAQLKEGHAITILGYSARDKPVYKINLGLDR